MKFILIKKRAMLAIVLAILCVGLICFGYSGNNFASVYFGDSVKLYPIYRVDTTEAKVALTFDAAWGADKTEGILEILDEFDIVATFFLVGFWVDKYPEQTRQIAQSGCEIGSHSFNHPDMTKLTASQMKQEITSTTQSLHNVLPDLEVKLFRPPFGAYNDTLINTLGELGMTGIQWDVDTLDWKGYNSSQVIDRVSSNVQNGSVILCHNNADFVLDNTRLIITTLLNRGYEFVTVSELVDGVNSVEMGVGKL